ncbi:chaperone TorD involved in molybdoenzyme TorA maturation [Marinospirillum celere]|uniref:Chaperone TorD involved in molybdoenzyme TorA maturation n=1 Tax=Marinospirillum celere TaxID=1122252 RepID=A0A1I1JRN1_9GAMM|nr:molecular chaperone TorD family protein [Marinospirillum celere]SFC51307.1 chaperone TorD involved in molybdoenzyme TorA maturation [Marinospirillum celere]
MNAQVPQLPSLMPRAEFYLCMAHVFLATQQGLTKTQLKEDLLADLHALSEELPGIQESQLKALTAALDELSDEQDLIKEYSRLFVTPPTPAPLNLGYYLDGGIMGTSTHAMEIYYLRYQLEKDNAFHDLPDHLALNLQWLAWVLAQLLEEGGDQPAFQKQAVQDIGSFINHYTLPGIQQLLAKTRAANKEYALSSTWLLLVEMTANQLQADLDALKAWLPQEAVKTTPKPAPEYREAVTDAQPNELITCNACGVEFTAGEALAEMISRLKTAGVTYDHLLICSNCRETSLDQGRMTPPGSKIKHKG